MAQENVLRRDDFYTFQDYLSWCEEDRIEIIDGVPYMMGAPKRRHQRISRRLTVQLSLFLEGKTCELFYAPFAVMLMDRRLEHRRTPPKEVNTVVEPDLFVVCDPEKLDEDGCHGAPDFIVEILSPSNKEHDQLRKLNLYQMAGVREYWIADPETKTVTPYVLSNGRYQAGEPAGDTLSSAVLEGFTADLRAVFAE